MMTDLWELDMTDLMRSNGGPSHNVGVEVITPGVAEMYLATRKNPRALRPVIVRRYAEDMKNGRWAPNSSASIAFDVEGRLRDGEHRLRAVILSGIPLTTVVVRGISEEAVMTLDSGLKRQFADFLRGADVPNASAVQAAVNTGWRWDAGQITTNNCPSTREADAWFQDHKEMIDAVHIASQWRSVCTRQGVSGAFILRARMIEADALQEFSDRLMSGANMGENHPSKRLRDSLLRKDAFRGAGGYRVSIHVLALMVKSWNSFMSGTEIRQLRWAGWTDANEAFPDMRDPQGQVYPFPEIVRRREA